jgi:hypothetical protein
MKGIIFFCLIIIMAVMSSCHVDKCDYRFGTRGVIEKFSDGPTNGGEYYVGTASSFAGHSVLTTSDPNIDLEAMHQSGEVFVLHCNYIKRQAEDGQLTPKVVDVIHVHEEDFTEG